MNKFKAWLSNVSIKRKFIPLTWFIIICVLSVSFFSFYSLITIDNSSENIIDVNVRSKEQLSEIIRKMYVCRVLGRDILLEDDPEVREYLYAEYITAFNLLDHKMDEYSNRLSGDQLDEFLDIIDQKEIYKESMIESADIRMEGGKYEDALFALQVVTPIATAFFESIDIFLENEQRAMELALEHNDELIFNVFVAAAFVNLLAILAAIFFIRFFSSSMSASLVELEKSLSEIAETGNMKIEIPDHLYTEDEIGRIAAVVDKMKAMLLEYSFNDPLTGGYNAKAYHEELADIFSDGTETEVWCVIADMNNLKLINDVLGHMEGDAAIRKSYYALNESFSKYGKTFRVGGDEFVSLLSSCTAEEVAESIVTITGMIETANTNAEHKFSLAFGFDRFVGNTLDEFSEFFKTVDKKMYDNKLELKQARLSARVVEHSDQS